MNTNEHKYLTVLNGVDFYNPRLTRNPRHWWMYLCWNIQFWMFWHKPYLPLWLRGFIFQHTDPRRHHLSWRIVDRWKSLDPNYKPEHYPLPWPICESAFGPFVAPWNVIYRWFTRQCGGRSHRCEFTDRQSGLLYNPNSEPYMDKLFEQFVENISANGGDDEHE